MAIFAKYDWECGIEHETQAVEVSIVKCTELYNGFCEQKAERPCQRDLKQLSGTSLPQIVRNVYAVCTFQSPLSFCTPHENDTVSRLAQRQAQDKPKRSTQGQQSPKDVSPWVTLSNEGAPKISRRIAKGCCPHKQAHGSARFVRIEQICDGAAKVGNCDRYEEA